MERALLDSQIVGTIVMVKRIQIASIVALILICFNVQLVDSKPISKNVSLFKHQSGLSFRYPATLNRIKHDGDTIVKLSGKNSSRSDMEISVGITDNGMNISVDAFEKILDKAMFSKLENMKKTKMKVVYVGKTRQIKGYLERCSFTIKSIPYCQDYLFIPGSGKIITFVLTSSQINRKSVDADWISCLYSIEAPGSLISLAPATNLTKKRVPSYKGPFSSSAVTVYKPGKDKTLEEKILAVLPRKEEERFLEIPWQPDILKARAKSIKVGKPLFIWIMDGNVLGAT